MSFFKRYSYLANGVAELLQEHLTSLFWAIAAAQLPHGISAALEVDFGVSSASSETTIGDAVDKCQDNESFQSETGECYTLDLIEATYVLSRLDTQSVHQVYLSLLVSLIIDEKREPLEPHEGARLR